MNDQDKIPVELVVIEKPESAGPTGVSDDALSVVLSIYYLIPGEYIPFEEVK